MKLTRKEIVRVEDDSPLELFSQGIKSKETLDKYTRMLRQVTCKVLEEVLEGTFEERVQQMVNIGRKDPGWLRDLLLNLSKKLRERTKLPKDDPEYLNPDSVGNYFKPIKKLLDMNDVSIPWKRIYATYPERDNVSESRGWTREEISMMLKHAHGPLDRALVLVLASSGMRAGGLDLIWEDLTAIYRAKDDSLTLDPDPDDTVACAVLRVYRGSSESYLAFITPEAFNALQVYGRTWAKMRGHLPGPKDPIFLVQTGARKNASTKILRDRVDRMAVKAGLRGDKLGKRFSVPSMNGFRRFWNKTVKESGESSIGSLIKKEYMMGHRGLVALDQNYFKTNLMELVVEYVKVVADLTIDDSERLKQSNRRMTKNIQALEGEKDTKMARLEAEAERMRLEVERVRREKDEAVERVREEVAEIRDRGGATAGATASEILDALRKSPKSGGVPGEVVESFTAMMDQLGAAQEAAMRDMKAVHDAEMADMKAEYDAKMERMMRVIDRMAKESDAGHDPLAGSGEDGPGMERRGHDQS